MKHWHPFYAGTFHGQETYYFDEQSRLDRVKTFTRTMCKRALAMRESGEFRLQKSVRRAIERRLKKLEGK